MCPPCVVLAQLFVFLFKIVPVRQKIFVDLLEVFFTLHILPDFVAVQAARGLSLKCGPLRIHLLLQQRLLLMPLGFLSFNLRLKRPNALNKLFMTIL